MTPISTRYGELEATVVGEAAGTPEVVAVLCHGYGAPGTDLVGLAGETLAIRPELRGRVRFVFPAAPLVLGSFGWADSRAWWEIDIGRFERAARTGDLLSLTEDTPAGLPQARRKLFGALDAIQRETGLPLGRFVLGGFSQGAMLATDAALRLEDRPAALVVWSGTLLSSTDWTRLAPARAGLPVLQTHGRQDPLLPFFLAEKLRDVLSGAGLEVDFVPFPGPHTIPEEGLRRFAALLVRLLDLEPPR